MATKKKMLQAAAGNAGGAGLDITEVFSTYLWDGNSSSQTINNGIDLSGEGGLVWAKVRNQGYPGGLYDTERGVLNQLRPDNTDGTNARAGSITAFNSNGFSIGNDAYQINGTGNNYASWTFRKAPKFFDCVTWTGDNTLNRQISHSLNTTIGSIFVKCTSTAGTDWMVYHKDCTETSTQSNSLILNLTYEQLNWRAFGKHSTQTSSVFTLGSEAANRAFFNASGSTYVAYLFAHNNSDGTFGPDGDQDIIKCGSYTGNSGNTEIDLGFEPQWIMIKRTDSAEDWLILDVMRGWVNSGDDVSSYSQKDLLANTSGAEATPSYAGVTPQPNGFKVRSGLDALYSSNNGTYIYMAVRRGQLALPEAGTEVFDVNTRAGTGATAEITSNIVVDNLMTFNRTSGSFGCGVNTRLTTPFYLRTYSKNPGNSIVNGVVFGTKQNGFQVGSDGGSGGLFNNSSYSYVDWMWKRAPSFFDAVCYSGTGSSGLVVNHNLGVSPELLIFKNRGSTTNWFAMTSANYGQLNEADSFSSPSFMSFSPTTFTINTAGTSSNASGQNYIAYLFAILDGVSKVGSYTGNGSSQTINAGFTTGARFILIKRTDSTGDWYVWDSLRGIVTGNDPHLSLNTTTAEVSDDSIDPDSSGFIVNQISATNINVSSAAYIYYAVA